MGTALHRFDVVGVAGSHGRAPRQAAWGFLDDRFMPVPQPGRLSGAVGHGKHPFAPVSYFGPAPADSELLDGLFLAAKARVLREREVRFAPQFDFHFYDMDFCRRARQQGLRVGTWLIALVHASEGGLDTPHWHQKYAAYPRKWEDPA